MSGSSGELSGVCCGRQRWMTPPVSPRRWRINFSSRSRPGCCSSGICWASSAPTRRNCTRCFSILKSFLPPDPEGAGHPRCGSGKRRRRGRLPVSLRMSVSCSASTSARCSSRRSHTRSAARTACARIGIGGRNTSSRFSSSSGSGSRSCFVSTRWSSVRRWPASRR